MVTSRNPGRLAVETRNPRRGAGSTLTPQLRASLPPSSRQVTLIDLLDRLLQGGIVIEGDITLSAANIDLVQLNLRLLISAVDKVAQGL